MKIINVVGARPNFMKIAPLMDAYGEIDVLEPMLVHTGQHYDEKMSDLFFRQLGIPEPDINLGVGSGSHAVQTAEVMMRFEQVLLKHEPDAVLVVGDVNSTIACGLVAVKMGVKLIHVEAGLRSGDRTMPEEINRVLTDSISDLLFCTEKSGIENLRREGIADDRVHLVGNLMIDTLLKNAKRADESTVLETLNLKPKTFAAMTLHRPSNVDDPEVFGRILDALIEIDKDLPIVFPIHPRTRKNIETLGLASKMERLKNLMMIDPLGYLDFLKLLANSRVVLTDSGGIQEETTILQVPCLTLRENTERPATLSGGGNQLVGTDPQKIIDAYRRVLNISVFKIEAPPMWDGGAAKRIVNTLADQLVGPVAISG